QAACCATVTEGLTRSILALRIAAPDGEPDEIEVVIARPAPFGGAGAFGDDPAALDAAGAPDSRWFATVPEAERPGRTELTRIADAYFTELECNDERGDYPFADDCIRIENGFRTTGVPAGSLGKTPYLETFRALGARQQ